MDSWKASFLRAGVYPEKDQVRTYLPCIDDIPVAAWEKGLVISRPQVSVVKIPARVYGHGLDDTGFAVQA